jgi:hypothetical protein
MEQFKNENKIQQRTKRPRIKRPVFSTKDDNSTNPNNSNKTKFDKK